MAKQVKLAAQPRPETGRTAVKKIKAQGFVPGVIYARNETPVHLSVGERDLNTVLAHAVGEHFLVDLEIAGSANRMALIQEVQHHPVSGKILHVDFHGVSANEEVESSVPLEPVGESIGVKSYGGILEQSLRSLAVSCLPANLPDFINVNVSAMKVGDTLHVRDLVLPEGVTALDDAERTVFHVTEPKVAVEPAADAPTAPEVIKEKKPAAEEKK